MKYNKSALTFLSLVLAGIAIGMAILHWFMPIAFMHDGWGVFILLLCAFYGIAIIRKGMEE